MDNAKLEDSLLRAMKAHVPFDGWSETAFRAAIEETNTDEAVARALFPRGAVDLARAYHKRGDQAMIARVEAEDLEELRFRDRIIFAVRARLEAVEDKELVRRGTTLFALPQYAATGAQLIWDTCDAIWTVLGDTSEDVNWYTKRMTLSAVYSSTVLYWLGDESEGHADTWAFLDRRIENVMQFEKAKAGFRKSSLGKLMQGPLSVLDGIKAPGAKRDMPGQWRG